MMRKFLLTTLRFVLIGTIPLLILLVVYIKSDPFKVLYDYDEYYDTNDNGRVGLNKDYVSSSTFLNNSKRNKHYDSFIFGSSRSIFYQISHWKTHLPINSNCFHFDASNETLYAMNKKVEFLDGKGVKIKNAGPPKYNPIFWIYYPDLRPTLSRTFAYNPKNMGGRLTWEEVFEGRFFSSYIIKSTLNNPKDLTLARLVQDPLFQLLEGENIKEKIFNYEQDLWSY